MNATVGAEDFANCTPGDIIHATELDGTQYGLTACLINDETILATDGEGTNYELHYAPYNMEQTPDIITIALDGKTVRNTDMTVTDSDGHELPVIVTTSGTRLETFSRTPNSPIIGIDD